MIPRPRTMWSACTALTCKEAHKTDGNMVVLLVSAGVFIVCCLCAVMTPGKETDQKGNAEWEESMCDHCPFNPHRDDEIV